MSQGSNIEGFAELYSCGLAQLERKEFPDALASLKKAQRLLNSGFAIVEQMQFLLDLSRALIENGAYAEAIQILHTVMLYLPHSPWPLIFRGTALLRQGDAARALADLTDGIAFYEQNQTVTREPRAIADAFFQCGLAHEKLEDKATAIVDYTTALTHYPSGYFALYRRALLLFDAKDADFAQIIADLTEVIRLAPKFEFLPIVNAKIAAAYLRMGNSTQALAIATENLSRFPASPVLHAQHGLALRIQNRHGEAIAAFDEAIRLGDRRDRTFFRDVHYERGRSQKDLNLLEEAIADFQRAVSLEPKYAPARIELGRALLLVGRYEQALAVMNETFALGLAQNNANAWIDRGYTLYDLQRYAESVENFNQGILLNPSSAAVAVLAHQVRIQCHEALNSLEALSRQYEEEINPQTNAGFHFGRGAVRMRLGNVSGAIADLQESVRLGKTGIALSVLAECLRHGAQYAEAIEVAKESVAFSTDSNHHLFCYKIIGLSFMSLFRYAEAIDYWSRYIEIYRSDASVHAQLGSCYRELERYDDALVCFQQSSALKNPPLAFIRRGQAECLFKKGDYENALPYARDAVRLDPEHPNGCTQLAEVLLSLQLDEDPEDQDEGVLQEAIELLQRAIALDPDARWARILLGRGLLTVEFKKVPEEMNEESLRLAAEIFKSAIAVGPQLALSHSLLGQALLALERRKETSKQNKRGLRMAIASFSTAIRLDPNTPSFWEERAEAQQILVDWLESRGQFTEANALQTEAEGDQAEAERLEDEEDQNEVDEVDG